MRGCLLASAALLCSGTAFAQEATPQANDQTGSATEALAEDIVVTATKKGLWRKRAESTDGGHGFW
jgi:iron complex outermembrane receptor protein